jgi:AraC-like DNA-binding protein
VGTDAEMVFEPPTPALRSIIAGYRGYRTVGAPGTHRGLPSPRCTFIISLEDPVDVAAMPANAQAPGRFQAFVAGLHAEPAVIEHDGRQHGISIDLAPLGARAMFGMPAGELAYAVVALDDIFGASAHTLVDQLVSAASWEQRFAVLDAALLHHVRDRSQPPREVAWAWQRLLATGGQVDIAQLARDVGYSRRRLGDLFRREVGLAPKSMARVMRFERSRRLIERNPANLATVAAACGYFDQAHLTREWRDIAGCPPTTWIAEELQVT